jgi:hypothetical protein
MHTGGYPPYSAPVRDPECRFVAHGATSERLLLHRSGGPKENSNGTVDELVTRLELRGSSCLSPLSLLAA